jgi:hypothetical protein
MKKITFLAILIASSINAQVFPDPYCAIEEFDGVEEITNVTFNSISVPIEYEEEIILDYTSTIFSVSSNETYTITVAGNTYGDWNNKIVVFIDWNQNGVLNDDGEIYEIGDIFDSNGEDGTTAEAIIAVPEDALTGMTRMRILKMVHEPDYDMFGIVDPCSISMLWGAEDDDDSEITANIGQFVDLTIDVEELSNKNIIKNLFSVYPNPVKDVLHLNSDKQIEEISIYNIQGQLVLNAKNTNEVNTSSLPIGQYVVKATSEGLHHTNKFVKQ